MWRSCIWWEGIYHKAFAIVNISYILRLKHWSVEVACKFLFHNLKIMYLNYLRLFIAWKYMLPWMETQLDSWNSAYTKTSNKLMGAFIHAIFSNSN